MKIHSTLFAVLLGTLGAAPVTGINWNYGSFDDYLNFTVGAANNVSGSFSDLDLRIWRFNVLNISNFDIDLYHQIGNAWQFVADIGSGDGQPYNGILAYGNYSFKVSGVTKPVVAPAKPELVFG
jgi:hypothetical protein